MRFTKIASLFATAAAVAGCGGSGGTRLSRLTPTEGIVIPDGGTDVMLLPAFMCSGSVAALDCSKPFALHPDGHVTDFSYREWNNKAAGFVSYGSAGGARAVEHLRLVMAELMVATVRAQVMLSLFTDFENFSKFKPDPRHNREVHTLLDQLIAWGGALKTLRG